MIDTQHPYYFLEDFFSNKEALLQFSRYIYKSDSLFDEREIFDVASKDVTREWVDEILKSLETGHELAFHSRVLIKGKTYHLPMIDFSCEGSLSTNVIDRIRTFIPKKMFVKLNYFKSGRSYHAYSTTLLTPKEWTHFMGRLLLVNPKIGNEIVDSRWIGHRLIGGYSSLRWSNNTGQYLAMPSKINHVSPSSNNVIKKYESSTRNEITKQRSYLLKQTGGSPE